MTLPVTLHVGAGAGSRWSATQPAGLLVLVEPNPALQSDLKALARAREAAGHETRVMSCAVSDQEGVAPFHLLSLADLSGLHDPEPLRRLLPGLRIDETINVQLRALTALLDEIPLAEQGNHLIIEAMGEEAALLTVIEAAGLLDRFSRIEIQAPTEALFARGLDTARLVARMEAADCRLAPAETPTDPDWPTLAFEPDHRLRGLRQQVRSAEHALATLSAERDAALMASESATAERNAALAAAESASAERDAAIVASEIAMAERDRTIAAAEAAAAESAAAEAACKATKAELVATRDRQQARIATLENNLNEARAGAKREASALEEAQGQIADLEIRLEEVEAANIQFQADLEDALSEVARLTADKDEAAELHAQRKAEWDGVRQRQLERISHLESSLNEARAAARRLETMAHHPAIPEGSLEDDPDAEGDLAAPQSRLQAFMTAEPGRGAASDSAAPQLPGQAAGPLPARELQAELARLRTENNRLGASLARSQQDASLALRLQALAQGDLKDLQGRYAALLARKEDQDRLLSQLATRLGDAAAYLQGPALTGSGLHPNAAVTGAPAQALPDSAVGSSTKRKKKSGKSGVSGG